MKSKSYRQLLSTVFVEEGADDLPRVAGNQRQPLGNGTGFKLGTLGVEKGIRGLQGGDLRLNLGHLAGNQGCALGAIDRVTAPGRQDVPDLGE